jgi:hypothetical protein
VVREIAPHLTLTQAATTLRKTIRPNFNGACTFRPSRRLRLYAYLRSHQAYTEFSP